MNEEYIDNVKHLIEQKDADQVKELLADLHPADIAELCNDLNPCLLYTSPSPRDA